MSAERCRRAALLTRWCALCSPPCVGQSATCHRGSSALLRAAARKGILFFSLFGNVSPATGIPI